MGEDEILLSVVVPLFNEEPTIAGVLSRLITTLEQLRVAYEIIVVDDCSQDASAEIAANQGVKVYTLKQHMGKGCALRAGFAKAKGEIVATLDSDGSHRPEELPLLLAPVQDNKADMVIGSRFSNDKPVSGKTFNAAGVRIFNSLIRVFTCAAVSDSQSGYRVMKSVVLENLQLSSVGYEIESEMLVKIAAKRFRIMEVPISFEQRTYGRSRLDPIADGFRIFLSIITSYLKG